MNKPLRIVTTLFYGLIIIFVNVTALLFFLMALSGNGAGDGPPASLLGVPGKYALWYHIVAVFAPAFISVSLGNLLRRISGFTPAFLLRIFWIELGGMFVFFLVLFLMRYYHSYR